MTVVMRYEHNRLRESYRKEEGDQETIYERDVIDWARWVTDADGVTEYVLLKAHPHGQERLAATTSPDGTTTDYGYR